MIVRMMPADGNGRHALAEEEKPQRQRAKIACGRDSNRGDGHARVPDPRHEQDRVWPRAERPEREEPPEAPPAPALSAAGGRSAPMASPRSMAAASGRRIAWERTASTSSSAGLSRMTETAQASAATTAAARPSRNRPLGRHLASFARIGEGSSPRG